jgi:hypothetical protein
MVFFRVQGTHCGAEFEAKWTVTTSIHTDFATFRRYFVRVHIREIRACNASIRTTG